MTPSRKKGKGIRPLIMGVVLVLLALFNILFSLVTNTAIEPFYPLLTVFGVCLAIYGVRQ